MFMTTIFHVMWDLGWVTSDVTLGNWAKTLKRLLTELRVLSKHILVICDSYFIKNGQNFSVEKTVSFSIIIWSLAMIWRPEIYTYFFHVKVQVSRRKGH